MEQKVSTTLSGLEGELKGKFYPLTGMEKTVQQQLIDDHFLFKVMALIALNETQLFITPLLHIQGGRSFPAGRERVPLLAVRPWHLPQRCQDLPGLVQ